MCNKQTSVSHSSTDILTKESFSKDEWNHLQCLFNFMSFSIYYCSHLTSFLSQVREGIVIGATSKRRQNTTSNDGSPTATPRNWMLGNCKLEVGYSQMSRQEKVLQVTRKLEQEDQAKTKSDENSFSTRKLAASSPEFKNMEYTNHRYMGKISQCLEMKLRMSATNATVHWTHTKHMY